MTRIDWHDFGDKDYEPCCDCGTRLYLTDPCYAVDSAFVCAPCGRARYGEHVIVAEWCQP